LGRREGWREEKERETTLNPHDSLFILSLQQYSSSIGSERGKSPWRKKLETRDYPVTPPHDERTRLKWKRKRKREGSFMLRKGVEVDWNLAQKIINPVNI